MEQRERNKQRDASIDCARAMAIVMIVMAHVLRRGHVADYLSSTGVAMFFFLSGLVYCWKDDRRAWWAGRFRRLYVPYLGVAVFSIVVYRVLGAFAASRIGISGTETRILPNLAAMLYANSKDHSMKWNETLWFIPCFLVVLALVSLAERGIRKAGGWQEGRIGREIGLRFLVCLIFLILHSVITRHLHWHLPWQAETALGMVPVFEAGIVVRRLLEAREKDPGTAGREESNGTGSAADEAALRQAGGEPGGQHGCEKSSRRGFVAAASVLLVLAGIALTAWNGQISIRTDKYPHDLLSYVVLGICVAGYVVLARAIYPGKANGASSITPVQRTACTKVVLYVGRQSLEVMLWNKFPVVAVQTIVPMFLPGFADLFLEQDTVVGVLLAFPLALVCVALCLVWSWILHSLHRVR